MPAAWVAVVILGAALAIVVPVAAFASVAAVLAYGLVMAAVTLTMPGRDVPAWRVLRAFTAVHAGYGIGMWLGVVRFLPRWLDRSAQAVPVPLPRRQLEHE